MVEFTPVIEHSFFFFAIASTLLGFYGYHFFGHSTIAWNYFSNRFSGDVFQINWILFQKITGGIFMAILPIVFYVLLYHGQLPKFGINAHHLIVNWKWLLATCILIVLLSSRLARSPKLIQQYPQMRINKWTIQRFALSAFGWAAYLMAYEFLFRGLLLYASYQAFGTWPAIVINVAIYSAVHLPKGMGETLGAIPFGILACMLTLNTGTILIPVVAHISLAISMEYFTIKQNPDMFFITIRNPKQIK
jgi:membrane protease YdiL (CAAX protease family)